MSVDLSVKKARIVSMNNVNKEAVQRIFNVYQSYKILYQGHKTSYIILILSKLIHSGMHSQFLDTI